MNRVGPFSRKIQVLLATLPEATPIHEAMQLERDLARAGIEPAAWIVNQSLTPLTVSDPVLRRRRYLETVYLQEVAEHAARIMIEPWEHGDEWTARPSGPGARLAEVGLACEALVVMGSQGRGYLAELFLGSVSHEVARHSAAPVLLVPLKE